MKKEPHGIPGQINGLVLDIDSEITGYGKHNRLIVCRGVAKESDDVMVREDIRGLPLSTEKDRRKVLRGYQNPLKRGERLTYQSTSEDEGNGYGPHLWHKYTVSRKAE